jgi:hypothetical protein
MQLSKSMEGYTMAALADGYSQATMIKYALASERI